MAKADIWMPIYVGDYLAATSRLTTEQHGAYLLLIMDYWKNGPLPDDDRILAQITRMSDDAWSMSSSILRAFFEQSNGTLVHSRIEREKAEAESNSSRNTARAKAAAEARWAKKATSNAPSMPGAVPGECPSPSPSPESSSLRSEDTPAGVRKKPADQPPAALPDGLDLSAWERWVEYRKSINKALKPASVQAAQKALAKHGSQQAAVVEQSIANGWQGLFGLKSAQAMGLPRQSAHSGFGEVDYREGINDDGSFA